LTHNTATGTSVIQTLHMTVLLLLNTTTGTRSVAATHRDTSVRVSAQLLFINTHVITY